MNYASGFITTHYSLQDILFPQMIPAQAFKDQKLGGKKTICDPEHMYLEVNPTDFNRTSFQVMCLEME